MAKQTYTVGQTLTAAQMTQLQADVYSPTVSVKTSSYVLVAADAGTRIEMNVASANTVTVNTSLFTAGDTLIVSNKGAGQTTITAGTATVSSAGLLTVDQYANGTLYFVSAGVAIWTGSIGAGGDITAITAGTGISVASSTGPVPTVSIDTATTVDKTTAQTLTNKTLTAPVISTISNTGTVTLPTATDTLVGRATTDTLTNKTLTTPVITTPKIAIGYSAKTAAYTVASGDEGYLFSMNNAATAQFSIPTDATFNFAIGTEISFVWITGAGQPTIGAVTPGTTTVISTGGTSATPKLRVANSAATAVKLAANNWLVVGDLS